MQKIRHDEQGFTLIELIVVVVIIGILAAIALPIFLNQRARAADARSMANVREAAGAVNVYYTETGNAPAGLADLRGRGFQGSNPQVGLSASGTAANPTWCVVARTAGGTQDVAYQSQANPDPQLGDQAAATAAGCPAAP